MAEKDRLIVDQVVENLCAAMPVFYRKLLAVLNENPGITHHQLAVLGMLSRADRLPVSELGKRLWISRPQMTAVIDKMVDLGLVTRRADVTDRRVIQIAITPAGQAALKNSLRTAQTLIARKLECLSGADLVKLAGALRDIQEIGEKIE